MAITVVVLAAVVVAVFGAGRMVAAVGSPDPSVATSSATLDNLTAQVSKAGWVGMDHNMASDAPGYVMPPAMMPGMPTGEDQRFAIGVTVLNTSSETRQLRPGEEFTLRGADGAEWTPKSHTFGELPRLAGHNAVTGMLYFDLPPAGLADGAGWLQWKHQGDTTGITIPVGGTPDPEHSHNS
jgi:hypothetical protein